MFGEKAGHRTTPYASLIDWLPVTDLPIYGDQLMSKRKLWLLQQAIFAAPDKHKLFRGRMLQDALTSELISS
jgi:hypothetical protein